MYWDADLETLNPAAWRELRLSRRRQTLERAAGAGHRQAGLGGAAKSHGG